MMHRQSMKILSSKDGLKWYKLNRGLSRQKSHNIIRGMGPHKIKKNLSIVDTFFCIMSLLIRDQICKFSNKKAEEYCRQ